MKFDKVKVIVYILSSYILSHCPRIRLVGGAIRVAIRNRSACRSAPCIVIRFEHTTRVTDEVTDPIRSVQPNRTSTRLDTNPHDSTTRHDTTPSHNIRTTLYHNKRTIRHSTDTRHSRNPIARHRLRFVTRHDTAADSAHRAAPHTSTARATVPERIPKSSAVPDMRPEPTDPCIRNLGDPAKPKPFSFSSGQPKNSA